MLVFTCNEKNDEIIRASERKLSVSKSFDKIRSDINKQDQRTQEKESTV